MIESRKIGLLLCILCIFTVALNFYNILVPEHRITHINFHALPEIRQNESFASAWEAIDRKPVKLMSCKQAKAILYVFGE